MARRTHRHRSALLLMPLALLLGASIAPTGAANAPEDGRWATCRDLGGLRKNLGCGIR